MFYRLCCHILELFFFLKFFFFDFYSCFECSDAFTSAVCNFTKLDFVCYLCFCFLFVVFFIGFVFLLSFFFNGNIFLMLTSESHNMLKFIYSSSFL